MTFYRRRSAFTIVELLVVISIVALLLSILLPSLSRARNLATRVKCASNMRQAIIASLSYASDSHDLPYNYNYTVLTHDEILSHNYTQTYNNQAHPHYFGEGDATNGYWEYYLINANYVTTPDTLGCAFSCPQGEAVFPAVQQGDIGNPGVSINTAAQIAKAPPYVYRGPSAADDWRVDIYACGQIGWQYPTDAAYGGESGSWYPHGNEIDKGKPKPLFTCPVFMVNPGLIYSSGESYAAPHNDNSVRTRVSLFGGGFGRYGHYLSESVGWTDGHAGGYEQPGPGGVWLVDYQGNVTQSTNCMF